jgi:uncharacterized protein (TIGR03083 family)
MVESADVAKDLPILDVRPLMPAERRALVDLLAGLEPVQWNRPTPCEGWDVHDIALHLLGNDMRGLSGGRDAYRAGREESPTDFAELASAIEDSNEGWVGATRHLSPHLVTDLLSHTGLQVDAYWASIDLLAAGTNVGWTGTGHSPNWLHIAREYTERWTHQQQIRLATDRPGFDEPEWLHPVLDTFMRALPRTYEHVDAPEGTGVAVVLTGPAGGRWMLRRDPDRWRLVDALDAPPDAEVAMPETLAWQVASRTISPGEARPNIDVRGDTRLAEPATKVLSIMSSEG